jgi:hypothetical protein
MTWLMHPIRAVRIWLTYRALYRQMDYARRRAEAFSAWRHCGSATATNTSLRRVAAAPTAGFTVDVERDLHPPVYASPLQAYPHTVRMYSCKTNTCDLRLKTEPE